jgi:hypothetical protein
MKMALMVFGHNPDWELLLWRVKLSQEIPLLSGLERHLPQKMRQSDLSLILRLK